LDFLLQQASLLQNTLDFRGKLISRIRGIPGIEIPLKLLRAYLESVELLLDFVSALAHSPAPPSLFWAFQSGCFLDFGLMPPMHNERCGREDGQGYSEGHSPSAETASPPKSVG
jgi:hypothetical protein